MWRGSAQLAHRVGARVIVDGVSFAPHTFPDVAALDADVYLFSLYKTYSVHQGLMVVRNGLLDELPNQAHFFNDSIPDKRLNPAGPDHAQVAAAGAVLDYVSDTHLHHGGRASDGLRAACDHVSSLWRAHEDSLTPQLLEALSGRYDVRLIGPGSLDAAPGHRCPTIAFSPSTIEPAAVQRGLVARGVQTSYGHYYARPCARRRRRRPAPRRRSALVRALHLPGRRRPGPRGVVRRAGMTSSDDGSLVPGPGDPGPLIAAGRSADVFDLGGGRVLRRYRDAGHDAARETAVMRYVAEHGVRVPTVFPLEPAHDPERDIVMEHLEGVTMLARLERQPWMALSSARLLARLQREIAAVPAPDWMMSPGWVSSEDPAQVDSVLHLDLHPMNVMLTARGPVVIDWANATGGPAGFDAAISYVEMATFEVDDVPTRILQQLLVTAFRRASGRRQIDAFLPAACDHRLADANITPGERHNVAALRARR